jgi:hypothetical protein
MIRSARSFIFLLLLAFPAIALARPPLIYHHVEQIAAHSGGTVRLRLSSHDLVVSVKPGKQVSVTTDIWSSTSSKSNQAELIKRYTPAVWASGDDVEVGPPDHHDWGWHFGWESSHEVRVTVVMPDDMKLDYRLGSGDFHFDNPSAKMAVKGESGSGDVHFKGDPDKLHLSAGSGDMQVAAGDRPGPVYVHTGSGDIIYSGSATSLSLGAGSGDITVGHAVAKSAEIGSGSGDLVVHWGKLAAGATIKASSGSGDVDMYFPASTVIGGKISTGSGDVNTDFPALIHGSHHSYTLSGGPGAITVDLDTGSGDISLHKGD